MLATNYLTADRLRITEQCRMALIRVLRKLECGEIAASDFNMEPASSFARLKRANRM